MVKKETYALENNTIVGPTGLMIQTKTGKTPDMMRKFPNCNVKNNNNLFYDGGWGSVWLARKLSHVDGNFYGDM